MAVSLTNSYKLLNAWQRIMLADIWHFNQAKGQGAPLKEGRNVYIQQERDDIARALNVAVEKAVPYLGFYPRPVYLTEVIPLSTGAPFQMQTLRTSSKYIEAFGVRAVSLIQAGAPIVYSDVGGIGANDTATITVPTTVSASEIQVFFRTADGATSAADEFYEIEPLTVTIVGANAVITGPRALFVKPSTIWDVPYDYDGGNFAERNYADTALAAGFVTAVDVYRVYTDSSNAVNVISDDAWTDGLDVATSTLTAAQARIVDARLGIFQVRPTCTNCMGVPSQVSVKYKAGLPLVRGRMHPTMEEALIRFSNTLMGQKIISLYEYPENKWVYDREAMPPELLQPPDVQNPFGIMRGQIHAWRVMMDMAIAGGGKVTR